MKIQLLFSLFYYIYIFFFLEKEELSTNERTNKWNVLEGKLLVEKQGYCYYYYCCCCCCWIHVLFIKNIPKMKIAPLWTWQSFKKRCNIAFNPFNCQNFHCLEDTVLHKEAWVAKLLGTHPPQYPGQIFRTR